VVAQVCFVGTTLDGVFRRQRPAEPETTTSAQPEPEQAATGAGKGRPTPKRRDAERNRRSRVTAPKDRKEAARKARERTRAERARRREGLMSGDPRYLSRRDTGPVRAFVRDYVDRRRSAAELFMPGALVILVLSMIKNNAAILATLVLWIVMLAAMVIDSIFLLNGVLRGVRRRFPDESRRGLWAYALTRSIQMRRLRLPRPRLKPGDPLPEPASAGSRSGPS
jgi:hypothetical protein